MKNLNLTQFHSTRKPFNKEKNHCTLKEIHNFSENIILSWSLSFYLNVLKLTAHEYYI